MKSYLILINKPFVINVYVVKNKQKFKLGLLIKAYNIGMNPFFYIFKIDYINDNPILIR